MFVGGEVGLVIGLIPVEVGDRPVADVVGGDDAVLGLLHFQLGLVVLGLRGGAFLEGGEVELVPGVEVEGLGEALVGLQEGVEVSSHDDLVLGQVLLQSKQVVLQVFDLDLVLVCAGAEMHAGEDEVVGSCEGHALGPAEVFLLFGVDFLGDFGEVLYLGEGVLVEQDEGVLLGVRHDVLVRFLQLAQEEGRVFLDEEDIGFQSFEALHELLELLLFVEEAHFVKGGDLGEEDGSVVLDGLFEGDVAEDVLEQCIVHDEVIELDCFFLLVVPLELEAALVLVELLLPLILELLPVEQALPEYSHSAVEHVRVPALLEALVDFAHLPLEGLLIEVLDVLGDELAEDGGDGCDVLLVIFEVELERAVGDAAVIEGGY